MARLDDLPDVTAGLAEETSAHSIWGVEDGGAAAAELVLHLAKTAHLANLAVYPDHCGKGPARSLIATAEQAARGRI